MSTWNTKQAGDTMLMTRDSGLGPLLVLVAGQHGDEPLAVAAAGRVLETMRGGSKSETYKHMDLVVCCALNPRALAVYRRAYPDGRTEYPGGQDYNRAWGTRLASDAQVEVQRQISDALDAGRRVLVLDLHTSTSSAKVYGVGSLELVPEGYNDVPDPLPEGGLTRWALDAGADSVALEGRGYDPSSVETLVDLVPQIVTRWVESL